MDILVVDDDPDFAEAVADLLMLGGHRVILRHDGESAAAASEQHDFHVCLIDLKLPGIDGITAASRVQASQPDAKVLIMSGYATPSDVSRALEGGLLDVMSKPFEVEELQRRLRRLESPARLLLVEDDIDFAATVSDHLGRLGFEVEHRRGVEEAVNRLMTDPPDLLLLDLRLGNERGLDVFREATSCLPGLPIILITAFADAEREAIEMMDPGNRLLRKPIDPGELVTLVDDVLYAETR